MAGEEKDYALMAVELATPTGKIRGQVRVDKGPMRLAEIVPTAYELTNVLTARANRRAESEGKSISCRAGCAACCRQMVPLSPPEAFFLMDRLDEIDPIRRAHYLGRFDAIAAELEKEKMVEPLLDILVGADPKRALNRKYFAMQMPCPYLIDESCSIHPDRPVACREYNVTSPAMWCIDPFGHAIDKVPMPIPFSAPLSWLTSDLTGEPPALIPLPLAPRWVAEHDDWRKREWPGLELFRKFMEIAGGPPRVDKPEGDADAGSAGLTGDGSDGSSNGGPPPSAPPVAGKHE